jgi:hypothetical protein
MCPSLIITGRWSYVLPKFHVAEKNKNPFGGCRVVAHRKKRFNGPVFGYFIFDHSKKKFFFR